MLQSILDHLRNWWKALIAVAVPILWEAAIDIINGVEGSFDGNAFAVAAISGILVWLKANRPLPT